MAEKQTEDGRTPDLELPAPFRRRRRRKHDASRVAGPAPAVVAAAVADPLVPSQRDPEARTSRVSRRIKLPHPAGIAAALVTGLLVGVTGTVLTWGGLYGCEAVRGTQSCGEGRGMALLAVILVVMVVLGSVLLALFGVADNISASVLAIGSATAFTILALLDIVFSPWMFLALPALTTATYAGAVWLSTHLDDGLRGADRPQRTRHHVDVS